MITILFLFTGCTYQKVKTLRLGVTPDPANELLFLAQTEGFLNSRDFSVELISFSSLADALRAFEWGLIDGMACTLSETLLAQERSKRDPDIILLTHLWQRDDLFLSSYSLEDFRSVQHKRIAIETSSVGAVLLVNLLSYLNLHIRDLTIVPTCITAIPNLFKNKLIDAAIYYPPRVDLCSESEKDHKLIHSLNIPLSIYNVIFIDHPIIKKQRSHMHKFILGWQKAADLYAMNPDYCINLMAQRKHMTTDAFRVNMKGLTILPIEQQIELLRQDGAVYKRIVYLIEAFKKIGFIDGHTRPEDMIYVDPLVGVIQPF